MSSPAAPRPSPGFTLVELLVVVLIVGILAAIALPRFAGQRTRSKNSAAQVAVRHALVAVRSWYSSDGKESYAGLCADAANARGENRCSGKTAISSLESSLGRSEPADSQSPGSGANPQDIWMGNGTNGTDPSGSTVTLCSVSRGDTVYCVKDSDGVASYYAFTGAGVQVGGDASLYSAAGWSSAQAVEVPVAGTPTVTGSTQQGSSLRGAAGSWSNTASSTAWSWTWRRCDTAGDSCADISGESGTSTGSSAPVITDHLLVSADVGKTLRLQVQANNAGGSCGAACATGTSAATATVTSSSSCSSPASARTGTSSYDSLVASAGATHVWHLNESSGNACDAVGSLHLVPSASGTSYGTQGPFGGTYAVGMTSVSASWAANSNLTETTNFTMIAWVKITTGPTNDCTAAYGNGSGWWTAGWAMKICSWGSNLFYAMSTDGTGNYTDGNPLLYGGGWRMVTFVRNGNSNYTYQNTSASTCCTTAGISPPAYSSASKVFVGASPGTTAGFTGWVGEMAYFPSVLSATTITNIYNAASAAGIH